MELQLGDWNYSWENGIIAGRMELQLGEEKCSWEKGSVAVLVLHLGAISAQYLSSKAQVATSRENELPACL